MIASILRHGDELHSLINQKMLRKNDQEEHPERSTSAKNKERGSYFLYKELKVVAYSR